MSNHLTGACFHTNTVKCENCMTPEELQKYRECLKIGYSTTLATINKQNRVGLKEYTNAQLLAELVGRKVIEKIIGLKTNMTTVTKHHLGVYTCDGKYWPPSKSTNKFEPIAFGKNNLIDEQTQRIQEILGGKK